MESRQGYFFAGFYFFVFNLTNLMIAFIMGKWAFDELPSGVIKSYSLWEICYTGKTHQNASFLFDGLPQAQHDLVSKQTLENGPTLSSSAISSPKEDVTEQSKEAGENGKNCTAYRFSSISALFHATRAVHVVALVLFGVALLITPIFIPKLFPILLLVGGLLIVLGSVMFHFVKKEFEKQESRSLYCGTSAYLVWIFSGLLLVSICLSVYSFHEEFPDNCLKKLKSCYYRIRNKAPISAPARRNRDAHYTEGSPSANLSPVTRELLEMYLRAHAIAMRTTTTTTTTTTRKETPRSASGSKTSMSRSDLDPKTNTAQRDSINNRTTRPTSTNSSPEQLSGICHTSTVVLGDISQSVPTTSRSTSQRNGNSGNLQHPQQISCPPRYETLRQPLSPPSYEMAILDYIQISHCNR